MELGEAQELAARGHFAAGAHRKEAAAAAAGRDVAHQPPGPRGHQPQQQVGEVAHHQLAPGFFIQLKGAVQRREEIVGQFLLVRHQVAAAELGAARRVEQGVAHPPFMEKLHQFREGPDVFLGDGGDDVQARGSRAAPPGS